VSSCSFADGVAALAPVAMRLRSDCELDGCMARVKCWG